MDFAMNGSGSESAPEPHEAIAPLSFLLGRWEGAGVVGYPTIESVNFGEEVSFTHNGKPFLIYSSRTWLLNEDGTLGKFDAQLANRSSTYAGTATVRDFRRLVPESCVVQDSKVDRLMPGLGQNENWRFSGLCRLLPAADMPVWLCAYRCIQARFRTTN